MEWLCNVIVAFCMPEECRNCHDHERVITELLRVPLREITISSAPADTYLAG